MRTFEGRLLFGSECQKGILSLFVGREREGAGQAAVESGLQGLYTCTGRRRNNAQENNTTNHPCFSTGKQNQELITKPKTYHSSSKRASLRTSSNGVRCILHIGTGEVRPVCREEAGAHPEFAVGTYGNQGQRVTDEVQQGLQG